MRSGKLKELITINKPSGDQDSEGYELNTVVKVFAAKADVKILSATELLKAGLALTTEYASVKMRYDKRLQYEYSINYAGNEYDVESIRPNDRKTEMIVTISRDVT